MPPTELIQEGGTGYDSVTALATPVTKGESTILRKTLKLNTRSFRNMAYLYDRNNNTPESAIRKDH